MPQSNDRTRLEEALRAADAAGDTAAATALAAELRRQSTLPPPAARAATAAAATKDAWQGISDNPVVATGQLAAGAFDVVGGGIAGLAERIEGVGRGLIGAVNPNDTYHDARKRTPAPIRDPQPVSAGGKVIQNALGAVIGGTRIPDVLNAVGGGIEAVAGPDAREALGTLAEVATLPLSRGKPPARLAPAGEALANVERNGFITSSHAPTGPTGGVAGTVTERAGSTIAGVDKVDALKSVANQEVTSRFAARGARLGSEFVEPATIREAVRRAEIPYDELRASGVRVAPDQALLNDAAAILNEASGISPAAARSVRQLTQPLDTGSVIDAVRQLRQQGFKRVAGDNVEAQEIGALQLRAADALDGVLDRSLQRAAATARQAGNTAEASVLDRLYQGYVDGRAWRADLHILEEVTNPTTGAVSPAALARISERRRMNPQYQAIVEAFQATPYSMQDVAKASRAAQAGTMDVAVGGGLGNALVNLSGLGKVAATIAVRRGAARAGVQRLSPWRREMNRRAERTLRQGGSAAVRATALNSALGDEDQ